ncbi:hypothetical protein A3C67_02275 [Candidatus Nomurabacteria bacterium RIFCSPHIGHO2_02_FULL_42_19]|uniref:Short-chain dehydrogenase n=1 Tax=Candidatus Nomurabacteria bacterium RIFCSPHIGHO2_02_FULL_42_19 TaxID=1801756 RepID=A0A1F6W3T1_9BACT|nr:MAG: hypothetical protein A3C67_02275 [Candidatus Nomurabacteria bacterium RIFCSPHIGHO2_02_FULL_42_19]
MELKDKVVVITGGSKGFGRALAEAFIKEGSKVSICALNETELQKTAQEIGALGVRADVRSEDEMKALAEKTIKEFDHLDIWINNAGLWLTNENAENNDMQKVREMFEINVIGLMNGSRVALRHMKKINSGTIINIASRAGAGAKPGIATYAASKRAVLGFTDSIREENKDKNILILSVLPGGMKTKIFGDYKYADFDNFMDTRDVANSVIENLKSVNPQLELLIQRPNSLR